ncbi:serine hydrolase family protein [Candidatus Microgenomates bacterium]|nr:serine hydrolase family protein [Candidatus Microgenomates bacterium]
MTVLILHGIGGHAGIHWQQWLYDELVKAGHTVLMPNLPNPDHPDREEWLKTAQKTISSVDLSKLIIIGHSLGVTTALDLIEKLNTPINILISVSGFSEDYGADLNSYFLKEKSIDFNKVNQNLDQAFVIYGDNDPYVPQETLKSLADQLGVKPKIFSKGGHLNTETGYTTFPYLLELFKGLALK